MQIKGELAKLYATDPMVHAIVVAYEAGEFPSCEDALEFALVTLGSARKATQDAYCRALESMPFQNNLVVTAAR
jgi:hypothetical protein